MRIGVPAGYGGLEDCLKEAEMVVFWSCDPESTNGAYAGFEGTPHHLWAKELGIEFVHIDPHYNPTAQLLGGRWIPIRPQTDAALAQAIMYVSRLSANRPALVLCSREAQSRSERGVSEQNGAGNHEGADGR